MTTRPNFLIIGAAKAATTGICQHLGTHPEIFISWPKEPFFFNNDQIYRRGWDWYAGLFKDAGASAAVGEGTTQYSWTRTYPNTAARIKEHLPDTRIIYSLRHPLRRIESHWIEHRSQGIERRPFNEAVREDPMYIDASQYWRNLSEYRAFVPDDRIHLLLFEEYKKDPVTELQRICRFLGVDDDWSPEDAHRQVYQSSGKREDKLVTNLIRRYTPGFSWIRRHSPRFATDFMSRWGKREIAGRPTWDPDTRAWAVEQVRDDAAKILAHLGCSEDYWILDSDA